MKLFTALLLVLGLVLQPGPSCSVAGLEAAMSMGMDCSGAEDGDPPMPDSNGKDMAAACHACVSRLAETPTAPQYLVWQHFVPGVPRQNSISGIALKPPIPPPREQATSENSI